MTRRAPRLPTGPPALYVIPHFSSRELEYIKLRYGQAKGVKEVMAALNVTERTAKEMASKIHAKLAIWVGRGDSVNGIIQATKRLIKLGIISTEE